MLWVSQQVHQQTWDWIRQAWPNEAVALWAGQNQRVVAFYPLQNQHPQPTTAYWANPSEVVHSLLHAQERGLELLAIVHSHPSTPAVPSTADRMQAYWQVPYVIASVPLRHMRAWRLPALEELPLAIDGL